MKKILSWQIVATTLFKDFNKLFWFFPINLDTRNQRTRTIVGEENPLKPLITVATRPEGHSRLSPAKDSHLISSRVKERKRPVN